MSAAGGKKRKMSMLEFDDEGATWTCTLCTYKNRFEAFKCEMCDTRKGTSTRKPKLNENVVEKQQFVQNFVVQQSQLIKIPKRRTHVSGGSPSTSRHSPESTSSGSVPPRNFATPTTPQKSSRRHVPIPDSLIYRSSPKKHNVTVKGVTVSITEFRSKPGVILDKQLITEANRRQQHAHPHSHRPQSVQ